MSKKPHGLKAVIPLYIVYLSRGCLRGRTKLQKIVFLIQDKTARIWDYEFQKGYYGPYSYKLRSIVDELVTLGFLDEIVETTASGNDMICYQITDSGQTLLKHWLDQNVLPKEARQRIDRIYDKYGRLPLPLLIKKVYKEYPEWTEKSVLLGP
jgi:uncharacterized protein YwgA